MKTKYELKDEVIFIQQNGEVNRGRILGIRIINNNEAYDIEFNRGVMTVGIENIIDKIINLADVEKDGSIAITKHFNSLKIKSKNKLKEIKKQIEKELQ